MTNSSLVRRAGEIARRGEGAASFVGRVYAGGVPLEHRVRERFLAFAPRAAADNKTLMLRRLANLDFTDAAEVMHVCVCVCVCI